MDFFIKRYRGICKDFSLTENRKRSLRINTLKTEEAWLIKKLESKGIKLKKIPYLKHGYWYESNFSMGSTPEYLFGYYHLQDAASQIPIEILKPKPGDLILDMCAAPGSKTSQAAQEMGNKGVIVAIDIKKKRLEALKNNLERLSVKNTIIYQLDAEDSQELKIEFDKILLDAPCSGNYCLEENWFEKRELDDFEKKSVTQKRLLKAGFSVLKKGGTLVYSTCSLEPEENEIVIDYAINELGAKVEDTKLNIGDQGVIKVGKKKLNADVKKCRRFWPHKTKTIGFFVAKLKKQ